MEIVNCLLYFDIFIESDQYFGTMFFYTAMTYYSAPFYKNVCGSTMTDTE